MRPVDPLQNIPENQLVTIIETIEDLPALGNTLAASDRARECFSQHAGQIVSAVTTTFPKELQQVIRAAVVSIGGGGPNVPLVEGEIICNREHNFDTTTAYEDSLPPINFDLDSTALSKALDLSKRVYLLSTLFLKTHLARLNDLKPEHLAKPNFQFSSYPFKNYPTGKRYTPVKTGQATFVEEYRARRALWRLQLFSLVTKDGTRVAQVSKEEPLSKLEVVDPARKAEFVRFWSHLTRWEVDEILSVQDFLDSSRISLRTPPSFIDTKIVIPQFYPLLKRNGPSSGSVASVGQVSRAQSSHSRRTDTDVDTLDSEDIPPLPDLPPPTAFLATPDKLDQQHKDVKDQDSIAIKRSTEAYNFFHRYGLLHEASPLRKSTWQNFRRLGFGIWDQNRLVAMELSRTSAQKRAERGGFDSLTIHDMAFTWRSVENQAPEDQAVSAELLQKAMTRAGLAIKTGDTPTPASPRGGHDGYFSMGTGNANVKEKKHAASPLSMLSNSSRTNPTSIPTSNPTSNPSINNTTLTPTSLPKSQKSQKPQNKNLSKIERMYGINAMQGDKTNHRQSDGSEDSDVDGLLDNQHQTNDRNGSYNVDEDEIARIKAATRKFGTGAGGGGVFHQLIPSRGRKNEVRELHLPDDHGDVSPANVYPKFGDGDGDMSMPSPSAKAAQLLGHNHKGTGTNNHTDSQPPASAPQSQPQGKHRLNLNKMRLALKRSTGTGGKKDGKDANSMGTATHDALPETDANYDHEVAAYHAQSPMTPEGKSHAQGQGQGNGRIGMALPLGLGLDESDGGSTLAGSPTSSLEAAH